jgi:hypothetical protein
MVCRAPSSVIPFPCFSFFPRQQLVAVHLDEGLAPRGLPQSCTCTTTVAYWGPATAGGGGGTAVDGAGVQGRGETDVTRVEFLKLDASMGLRSRQGRGPPRPPGPHPPARPPRRPGPPPPRPRQGRVTGIVICSTAEDLCFLPSRLIPILFLYESV